ncbi:MAG: hypothetical protein D3925_04275 [Candidatus Electrothrix sp. AR5]|nr:hypothetical protein [Candidatus Electrothrix sp. AR5]
MNTLAHSPSTHGFLNQPFHLTYSHPYTPPEDQEEIAYQRIWKTYQEAQASHNQECITLVLKCMARNLGTGERLLRFLDLTNNTVLLIRNPYLSIDSLLRTQVATIAEMPEASQHNIDQYALHKDAEDQSGAGKHWLALKRSILTSKEYKRIEELLIETMAFIELNQYEKDMALVYKRRLEDHAYYSDLSQVLATAWSGWENMGSIIAEHLAELKNFSIVDATILRCLPEETLHTLCNDMKIAYSAEMVHDWQPQEVTDDAIIQTSWMKHCYEAVASSSGIKPPAEVSISLDHFPTLFQDHITQAAYPIYTQMLNNPHALRPRDQETVYKLLNTAVQKDGTSLQKTDPLFSKALLSSEE